VSQYRYSLLLAFLLLPAPLSPADPPAEEPAEARDAIEQVWDFGYLPQKSTVSYTYYLVNDGSVPLEVTKIKSGCSCTTISELKDPIPPGDSAAVEVTFKSGRYHKKIKKTTRVFTDDAEEPSYLLHLEARVFKRKEQPGSLRLEPVVLEWDGSPGASGPLQDTLMITNTGDVPLLPRVVHLPSEVVELSALPDRIAPGTHGDFILELRQIGNDKDYDGLFITIALDGPDTVLVTVPITLVK
jgi:hypothetical protein